MLKCGPGPTDKNITTLNDAQEVVGDAKLIVR